MQCISAVADLCVVHRRGTLCIHRVTADSLVSVVITGLLVGTKQYLELTVYENVYSKKKKKKARKTLLLVALMQVCTVYLLHKCARWNKLYEKLHGNPVTHVQSLLFLQLWVKLEYRFLEIKNKVELPSHVTKFLIV